MDYYVIKRDGRKVAYESCKIKNAIKRSASDLHLLVNVDEITEEVERRIQDCNCYEINVEQIQDLIEQTLDDFELNSIKNTYANYRKERTRIRDLKSELMDTVHAIGIETDRDNANVGNNFSSKLLRIASETNKWHNLSTMPKHLAKLHELGDLYYHDLDSYNLTTNCLHIDTGAIFEKGFNTGYGTIKKPKRIESDIIEIGAVYIENNQVKDQFNELVKPNEIISEYITGITGITNEMVKDAAPIEVVLPRFIDFCRGLPLIGHNIEVFDYRMLRVKATRLGLKLENDTLDTLIIARKMLWNLPSRKLGDLCNHYGIDLLNAHRAYDDAYATSELFRFLRDEFETKDPELFKPHPLAWQMPKQSPITAKQKKYLLNLCNTHKITLEKEIESLSKSEASKAIDTILREYGR